MKTWISVEDRLPELKVHVIGYDKFYGGVHEAWLMDDGWRMFPFKDDCHITHWMPLPEPPK